MTVIPIVRQIRRQLVLAGGSVRFEVSNQITDRGDLPFPHLFVVTISDSVDPKDDVLARIATPVDIRQADPTAPIYVKVVSTDLVSIVPDLFARIANVNDISRMPRDRVTAQRQGLTEYLTTAVAVVYDNVTTADAAAKAIVDRLSTLVTDWRTYNVDFATNPYQDYNLPQTAIGVESQRAAIYKGKRTDRQALEAIRDAAQIAKDKCERDCAANKIIYDFLAYDVAFLDVARSTVVAQVNEAYTGIGYTIAPAILTPAGPFTVTIPASKTHDYVLQSGVFSADNASYQALLVKKRADLTTYAQKVRECDNTCAQLAATLLTAQQDVNAAVAAERTALANVIAVCPTFDPNSV